MSTTERFERDRQPIEDRARMPELIRSEEELVIDRRTVEAGRVRLVKRIVTETVTKTVQVRREELHVERLPASDEDAPVVPAQAPTAQPPRAQADRLPARLRGGLSALQRRSRYGAGDASPQGPFADEDMEIVLMQEEVVVTKRVVPREKVRLRRETVVEQHEIAESVRKEQVELIEEPIRVTTDREDR